MNEELREARERIEALETTVSYQELELSEMSDALFDSTRRVERLETLLRELTKRFKELSEGGLPALPENERPPHY